MYRTEIEAKNKYTEDLTDYVCLLREKADCAKLMDYAALREIDLDAVKSFGMFYIGNPAEMLIPKYLDRVKDFGVISLTNNKPIFSDRYVIPIKDIEGKVVNLVGYKRDMAERYIYGTAKYYSRTDTLYGLDNLELAYDMGYAILTEGITDCQRLRSLGYPNSFAMCGTHKSSYIKAQLSRCRYGVIRIPDRDKPGLKALKGWEYSRTVTLYVAYGYKDADAMLRTDRNKELFKEYMQICIKEIKEGTMPMHKEITII